MQTTLHSCLVMVSILSELSTFSFSATLLLSALGILHSSGGWEWLLTKNYMIPKKKINILGKDVEIAFNMATQMAYEEITGKAFDTETLDKVSNTMALYYSCILANNKETDITFDQLIEEADAHDIAILREAVIGSFTDWCKSANPTPQKKKEKAEKNA